MLRRVALVRTDVSEELSSSFIRVTGIGELGTTLSVTRYYFVREIITKLDEIFCLIHQFNVQYLSGNKL
jgi:hypothetical protein